MKKLSIITVTYNSERFLKQTIESVLSQLQYVFEYWIIDGQSTDNTIGIIKSYLPKFQGKLHYISEKDRGIYDAMNKGIHICTGDIIGIINSDDYYNHGAFHEVVEKFTMNNIGLLYSDVNRIDIDGKLIKVMEGNERDLKYGMSFNHPTCFISKTTYKNVGVFDLHYRIAADYDLALRIRNSKIKIEKSNLVLSSYRDGGISNTSSRGIYDTYQIQKKEFGCIWASFIYLKSKIRFLLLKSNF